VSELSNLSVNTNKQVGDIPLYVHPFADFDMTNDEEKLL